QDNDGRDRYGREDSDEENLMNFNRRTSYDKNLTLLLGDKDDHNIPFPVDSNNAPGSSNKIQTSSYTYTHPRSYDSWEQYKMISRLPMPVTHNVADDGVSTYE
ncbi:1455_t:CDS:2, partial [Racocetra fulgida]